MDIGQQSLWKVHCPSAVPALPSGGAALDLILSAFHPKSPQRAERMFTALAAMPLNVLTPYHVHAQGCLVVDRGPGQPPLLHFSCNGNAADILMAAGDVALALRLALGRPPRLRAAAERRLRVLAALVAHNYLCEAFPQHEYDLRLALGLVAADDPNAVPLAEKAVSNLGAEALWPWLADETLWSRQSRGARFLRFGDEGLSEVISPDFFAFGADTTQIGADLLQSPDLAMLWVGSDSADPLDPGLRGFTFAAGAAAQLLAASPYHSQYDLARYIADEMLPPLELGQALVLLSPTAQPIGLLTWARISTQTEVTLHQTGRALLPLEWQSGPVLFFNDWITPNTPVWPLVTWARREFPDRRASSLRRRHDRSVRRINTWRGAGNDAIRIRSETCLTEMSI